MKYMKGNRRYLNRNVRINLREKTFILNKRLSRSYHSHDERNFKHHVE